MDSLFILKLVTSFIIGSIWVVGATMAADRFGSKIGGIIAGLPSTVMFGLFFLAWTQNAKAGAEATTLTPFGAGFTCLFIVTYCLLVKRSFWGALISALFLWAILAVLLLSMHFQSFLGSVIAYVMLFLISFYVLEHKFHIHSVKGKKLRYTPFQIVSRGAISGAIIALAVILGKIGGPVLGGMFSMFPATFTSTILITYLSQGKEFSSAVMKSTMVGAVTTVIYPIVVRYTYIPMGIVWGTIASIIISFTSGYFIYRFVITKLT